VLDQAVAAGAATGADIMADRVVEGEGRTPSQSATDEVTRRYRPVL
jgi:hypothetical protein